ncbi:LppM family (lipo)protein [Flindersiella endophytica]
MALALSGCLDVRSSLVVAPNNTVSGELLLLADRSQLSEEEGSLAESFAKWRAELPDLPPGEESVYDEGGKYGTRIRFSSLSFDDFSQGKALQLMRKGNRVIFSLSLDPAAYVRPNRPLKDARSLLETMTFDIKVTLPGKVQRHNGSLSGRTVSWQLGKGTEASELRAESVLPVSTPSPKPAAATDSTLDSRPRWPLIGGGILIAAGLVLGVLAWRRRAER